MSGFQTNVLRDGAWVTTTVSTQQALHASSKPEVIGARDSDHKESTQCGILTRTIAPSPVVHWVLPAYVRSKNLRDVAFVGSYFVEIRELRRDGQLLPLARKDDFRSRIRNAVVFGDPPVPEETRFDGENSQDLPDPGDHAFSGSASNSQVPRQLPPQLLVLFFEDGSLAFLFVTRTQNTLNSWKFETSYCETSNSIRNMGFHVAIDPSWRYLAAASSQKVMMIWELESRESLEDQYRAHSIIKPLKQCTARSFQGTLIQLEFLYPRAEDRDHIILVMFVSRRDSLGGRPATRLVSLDWVLGDDLQQAFKGDHNGTRVADQYRMPLMIIPIRFHNSFYMVCATSVVIVRNAISGSPEFDLLMREQPVRNPHHYGKSEPLWAAWARPVRLPWFYDSRDVIVLAREDGFLLHLEIDSAALLPTATGAGSLDSSVFTFAIAYDRYADIIIATGDSGPGGTWVLQARQDPVRASTIRNWSPVLDMTTSPAYSTAIGRHHEPASGIEQNQTLVTASGRGSNGSLTAFRWGQEARVGLDLDTESVTRDIWSYNCRSDHGLSLQVLVALPDSSIALEFPHDLSEVRALDANETGLDLLSRTLCLYSVHPDVLVQVTEHCIVVSRDGEFTTTQLDSQGLRRVEHAACTSGTVALATQSDPGSSLHTWKVEADGLLPVASWHISGEVTCLGFGPNDSVPHGVVVAGTLVEGFPWISVFHLDGTLVFSGQLNVEEAPYSQYNATADGQSGAHEILTSIEVLRAGIDGVHMIVGTHFGRVLTVHASLSNTGLRTLSARRFGKAPAKLCQLSPDTESKDIIISCDGHVIALRHYSEEAGKHTLIDCLIATNSTNAAELTPFVHGVCALPHHLMVMQDTPRVLMLTGSRILLAELSGCSELIPRSLSLGANPTRVIYSKYWRCYVVSLIQNDRPTLAFVDPVSGSIISQACDSRKSPVEYIKGLGEESDRILCIKEWLFEKDGSVFPYILVTTMRGCLITVSAKVVKTTLEAGSVRCIQYWTRTKSRFNEPVYAATGDDYGIICCVGSKLLYTKLDSQEKKMKVSQEIGLHDPVHHLQVRNGRIYALSDQDGLLILDYTPEANPEPNESHAMQLVHESSSTQTSTHMLILPVANDSEPMHDVILTADMRGYITGHCVPTKPKEYSLAELFRAPLAATIRRFAVSSCRPSWSQHRESGKFGSLKVVGEGADIFGISLDGTLTHFTLLGSELLLLLTFIQRHIETMDSRNSVVEIDGSELSQLQSNHVDGNVLTRCLKDRLLEVSVHSASDSGTFWRLLDLIEEGVHTQGFREAEDPERLYLGLAYDILAYFTAPVL